MNNEYFEEKPVDPLQYWNTIKKRKWVIITTLSIIFTVVTIATFLKKPIYKATGILYIEKEANVLTFQDIFQIDTYREDFYQTQFKLLKSRSLAKEVIEKLRLNEKPEFTGKKEKKGNPELNDSISSLVDRFLSNLEVKPIRMTRLVEVNFKSEDPVLSAEVVNTLFDSFIERDIRTKYRATEEASAFLTRQIEDLKREIERGEKELQEYGAQKNIIALSEKETTVVEKLAEISRALTEAQIERVKKEVYYNQVKDATPDTLPEVMKNPVIKTLQEDYFRISREYTKKSEIFKADYPEMIRLRAEMENARKNLGEEVRNIIKGAYSDYQAALKKESSLKEAFEAQKREAIQLNSNAILYNSLKMELENKRNLLDNLLRRQAETDITARLRGLRTSGINIVDKAEVPRAPFSPKKKRNMLLSIIIGIFAGVGLAFFFEYIDRTLKSAEDVERIVGFPFLGYVPYFDPKKSVNPYGYYYSHGKKRESKKEREEKGGSLLSTPFLIEKIAFLHPNSSLAEHFRNVQTSLLLAPSDTENKVIVVSSCVPGEGKTTLASNLGIIFSRTNKKTLLMDCDLRNPKLHRIFNIKNIHGLTHFLSGKLEDSQFIKKSEEIPDLSIINAGITPPNAAELLSSSRMEKLLKFLKEKFDYIIIDSPPLLLSTESYIIASIADAMVIVVNSRKTPREVVLNAKKELEIKNIKVKGIVLNYVSLEQQSYYYKYSYYPQRKEAQD